MADIALIYPPYTYTRKNPPLGLAYLASALEQIGTSVKILDMSTIGMDYFGLEKELKKLNPKIVGISFMTNQFAEAIKVSEVAKKCNADIKVVVGGPHVSALPKEALSYNSIDFVSIGEGERTLQELTRQLLNNTNDFKTINGLGFKKDNQIVITEPRKFIEDLDSIPFPAWHLLPVEKYSMLASGADVTKTVLPIVSSRGCPNQCVFCDSHSIFGRCFRSRSAENILKEIMLLKETYNVTQFDFVDDTITVNRERIKKLCELILENNLEIKWMCNARVNTVDFEILKLMKKAGCVRIDLGVESGDPEVLKTIKKGITIEQIKTAHKMVQEVGIRSNSFVMVGNLDEDLDSVKKTVALVKDFAEDINVAIATPFPGTELYQIAKQNRWLRTTNWEEYVTSPTYFPGYRPIMTTDKMNEEQIMQAFFFVHSRFAKKKFETRYGKHFYFKFYFYSDVLLKIKNWKEFKNKVKLALNLLLTSIKRN